MKNTVTENWMDKAEFLKYADITISKFYKLVHINEWLKKGIIRKTGNEITAVCLENYNKWLKESK